MCCPDMERMSNTWVPFYFTDKHQGSNGFFEREMAHSISHLGIVGTVDHGHSQKLQLRKFSLSEQVPIHTLIRKFS